MPARRPAAASPATTRATARRRRRWRARCCGEFTDCDYVVVPSGSCGGMIKTHYPELLSEFPELRAQVEWLTARTWELTDFLVNVLKLEQVPGRFHGTITYHDSCSGLREMDVKAQPRALLAMMPGLSLKEMSTPEQCCGFGGTFAVKYGDISARIAIRSATTSSLPAPTPWCWAISVACSTSKGGCAVAATARRRCCTWPKCSPASGGEGEAGARHRREAARARARVRPLPQEADADSDRSTSKHAPPRRSPTRNLRQGAVQPARASWSSGRASGPSLELDNFEAMREAAKQVRDSALEHLDFLLEEFERNATARGAKVHWAEDVAGDEPLVLEIASSASVRKVDQVQVDARRGVRTQPTFCSAAASRCARPTSANTSSRNPATRPPTSSRPAIHRRGTRCPTCSHERHRLPRKTDIGEMTREAREMLRPHFLTADMGITGANFLVARDRHHDDRDQRRQRPHDHHAAARARGDRRHREGAADAGGRVLHPAPADALGHRAVDQQLPDASPPARSGRATRTAPRSSTSSSSTPAARGCSARSCARRCAASAAARA